MCGIAGLIDTSSATLSDDQRMAFEKVLESSSLDLRGPDAKQVLHRENISLCHFRLKVIDTMDRSNQPMTSSNGEQILVYNGEIYNYQELRKELTDQGHRFETQSDTEVILIGYRAWGIDKLVKALSGMFSFFIWDFADQVGWAARDAMGKKPFFYHWDGQRFAFSSTLESLFTYRADLCEVDQVSMIWHLFSYAGHQHGSIAKSVKKLLPGHYYKMTSEGLTPHRYHQIGFRPKHQLSDQKILKDVEGLLRKSIERRLIADVPLGALLSGGIDSGLIVSIASQIQGRGLKTFTIGYQEKEFSEVDLAQRVAEKYQTDHEIHILKPDVLNTLPFLIWNYGEPFADSSEIATFQVCRFARQKVTVALTGDGGDEAFGGYTRYRAGYMAKRLDDLFLGKTLLNIGDSLGVGKAKTVKRYLKNDCIELALKQSDIFNLEQLVQLHGSRYSYSQIESMIRPIIEDEMKTNPGLDPVDQLFYQDYRFFLHNDLLVKADGTSMMNSLELRSPFLDKDLIEYAAKIPIDQKMDLSRDKKILRELAKKYLPLELVSAKKRGFELPVKHWFRSEVGDIFSELIHETDSYCRNNLSLQYVERLLKQHRAQEKNHSARLWTLLCIEVWHRLFVTKTLKASDGLSLSQ